MDDQAPGTLAKATLKLQQTYRRSRQSDTGIFVCRDWGVEDKMKGHAEGTRQYTKRVIQHPHDWEHLPVLDVSAPHLAAQLECLRMIRAELEPIRHCCKRYSIHYHKPRIWQVTKRSAHLRLSPKP